MRLDELRVRAFVPADQAAVRELILSAMEEHWGELDPAMNPDLDDIARSYGGATFLVAVLGKDPPGHIVGTGALVDESAGAGAGAGRIVRMAVAIGARRRGIGRALPDGLLCAARGQGFRRVVLETADTWHEAMAFYRRSGFRVAGRREGEVHMELELPDG